jgi:hypothetical protein
VTRDETAHLLAHISTLWGRPPAGAGIVDAWADELVDVDPVTARRIIRNLARDGARGPSLADLLHATRKRRDQNTEPDESEPGCTCRFQPGHGWVLCSMHIERGRRWLARIAADRVTP